MLDWYVEGPGRRVGYDNLTAIDWTFEYTKERQRKRLLYSSGQGFIGHVWRLLDAGKVWFVLVATGVAVGLIAAAIDIASTWLGDIKSGYCKNTGPGVGKFYLNRKFCCWGLAGEWAFHYRAANLLIFSDVSDCRDWTPWSTALGVNSAGGGYTVEYLFFILYSVIATCLLDDQ